MSQEGKTIDSGIVADVTDQLGFYYLFRRTEQNSVKAITSCAILYAAP